MRRSISPVAGRPRKPFSSAWGPAGAKECAGPIWRFATIRTARPSCNCAARPGIEPDPCKSLIFSSPFPIAGLMPLPTLWRWAREKPIDLTRLDNPLWSRIGQKKFAIFYSPFSIPHFSSWTPWENEERRTENGKFGAPLLDHFQDHLAGDLVGGAQSSGAGFQLAFVEMLSRCRLRQTGQSQRQGQQL